MTPEAAVLLGGGHGRRAGGPKACKDAGGVPWWRVQAQQIAATGPATVVAVLHPLAWQLAAPPLAAEQTVAADPDAPMLASLQRGLAVLPPLARLWVLPVDCPWPGAAVAAVLRGAADGASDWWAVRPCCATEGGNRGGHPLVLSAAGVAAVQALDPQRDRLDHWLAALPPGRRLDVTVDDPAVLANFNRDGMSC